MSTTTSSSAFVIDRRVSIRIAPGEDGATRLAAEYLAGDLEAILGRRPAVAEGLPERGERCIFIASADNAPAAATLRRLGAPTSELAGAWEAYAFHAAGEVLAICGADAQATMRGVWGFCGAGLGVDPMHRWNYHAPQRRTKVVVEGVNRVVGSPAFKFRGWFLNAGGLIRWNLGRGPEVDLAAKYGARQGDRGISGPLGRAMTEMVVEAALRSDMNMVIPLSYLDLDDADERAVADTCREFGIYLSHHHQEPLGANLRNWGRFWAERGQAAPEMSYYTQPAAFEQWWRHYAELWAEYPRTVHVIGHRGPGDRPFWNADKVCPSDDATRGKLISKAMAAQVRIIRAAVRRAGGGEAHYCATLWQEGSPLHASGVLRFPPGTMVVMADLGSKQHMREDFFTMPRRSDLTYGVYYHVCYGPGGPGTAQGNSPDRMAYAMNQVAGKGDTALALLNVGNIRPFQLGLDAWTRLTTRPADVEPEAMLLDWCADKFGQAHAEEIAECYNTFFNAYIRPDGRLYDGHRGFWDGVLANESWRFCQLMYNGDVEAAYRQISRPFPSAEVFMRFHRNKTAAMLPISEAVCKQAAGLVARLTGPAKMLLEENLLVQAHIMRGLTEAAYLTARAGLALAAGRRAEARRHVAAAVRPLEQAGQFCVAHGNRGVFKGWYTQGRVGKGGDLARMLRGLDARLGGRKLPADEAKWLDQELGLRDER